MTSEELREKIQKLLNDIDGTIIEANEVRASLILSLIKQGMLEVIGEVLDEVIGGVYDKKYDKKQTRKYMDTWVEKYMRTHIKAR